MTLAHARRLEIGDQAFFYVLKGKKQRYHGWSSSHIRLVVDMSRGQYVSLDFLSKAWTEEHESGEKWAPKHVNSFTPRDVITVVEALTRHRGSLPKNFQLPSWSLVLKEEKPKDPPLLHSTIQVIGRFNPLRHLSINEFRAVVFQDPKLTIGTRSYQKANLHVLECAVCKSLVRKELRENPLIRQVKVA